MKKIMIFFKVLHLVYTFLKTTEDESLNNVYVVSRDDYYLYNLTPDERETTVNIFSSHFRELTSPYKDPLNYPSEEYLNSLREICRKLGFVKDEHFREEYMVDKSKFRFN